MDDWEELESWHEDLRTWERFQDELEKINEENLYEMRDSQNTDIKRFNQAEKARPKPFVPFFKPDWPNPFLFRLFSLFQMPGFLLQNIVPLNQ